MNEGFLKGLVFVLGVLIFAALGFLVYTIAVRSGDHLGHSEPYSIRATPPPTYALERQSINGEYLVFKFTNDERALLHIYSMESGQFLGEAVFLR